MSLLHTPAPQRPGFRKELEHQVQSAIHNQSPMSSRQSYLKYLLGIPLVGVAIAGLAFALKLPANPTHSWTATEVQAAVVQSIQDTFSNLQTDKIHHLKSTHIYPQNSDNATYAETTEQWTAGLNRQAVTTNAAGVKSAELNIAIDSNHLHNCMYSAIGITYDGLLDDVDPGIPNPKFDCKDNDIATTFATTGSAQLEPISYVKDSDTNDAYIIVQWDTTEPIISDITVSTLTASDREAQPYEASKAVFELHPMLGGVAVNQSLPEVKFNVLTEAGYSQTIYLPELAYSKQLLPNSQLKDIYFQLRYQTSQVVTSVVYNYIINKNKIIVASPAEVENVETSLQIQNLNQLADERAANNSIGYIAEAAKSVEQYGQLQSYQPETVDGQALLRTTYIIDSTHARTEPVEGYVDLKVTGAYSFLINPATSQVLELTEIKTLGGTNLSETTKIEASEVLTDDPTNFFTETHWRQVLSERGVQE